MFRVVMEHMAVVLFLLFLIVIASSDASALTLKQQIPYEPVVIYYPDGTTYTLREGEVVHIAREGDTVYTKEEGDDFISFIINYPSVKRDYELVPIEADPCAFSLCNDPGE